MDANSPHGLYNHQYMQNVQAPLCVLLSGLTDTILGLEEVQVMVLSSVVSAGLIFTDKVADEPFQLKNLNSDDETSAATLYTGQNLTLTADYQPKDTTDEVQITWTSTNPSVASVQGGKVTAHTAGSTTITAE